MAVLVCVDCPECRIIHGLCMGCEPVRCFPGVPNDSGGISHSAVLFSDGVELWLRAISRGDVCLREKRVFHSNFGFPSRFVKERQSR